MLSIYLMYLCIRPFCAFISSGSRRETYVANQSTNSTLLDGQFAVTHDTYVSFMSILIQTLPKIQLISSSKKISQGPNLNIGIS